MNKRFKHVMTVLLVAVLSIALLAACGSSSNSGGQSSGGSSQSGGSQGGGSQGGGSQGGGQSSAPKLSKFEIGGGALGGTFYVMGGAFAKNVQDRLGIPSTATVTEGVAENLRLLDSGDIEAAIGSSNALYLAWLGQDIYEKEYKNLRLLFGIQPLPQIWFALKDSGLTKFTDIKGKRVGVGVGPSTWDPVSRPVLEAHGLDYDKDIDRVYGNHDDMHRQLGDGLLSAVITGISGHSLLPATEELMASKELVGLEFDPDALDRLVANVPYYTHYTLPAGLVPGWEDREFKTVSQATVYFFTTDKIPEDTIYEILDAIYSNLEQSAQEVKYLQFMFENQDIMTQEFIIPFHDGAIKFWKEKGMWKE